MNYHGHNWTIDYHIEIILSATESSISAVNDAPRAVDEALGSQKTMQLDAPYIILINHSRFGRQLNNISSVISMGDGCGMTCQAAVSYMYTVYMYNSHVIIYNA